jgi:hypothetical protein
MSTSGVNSPKGYYLSVGINDFSAWNGSMWNLNNLNNCINDVIYWEDLFYTDYYYAKSDSYSLTDGFASRDMIILTMYNLAQKAVSGDIVTITFSTHGIFFSNGKSYNLLTSKKEEYIDNVLLVFILKWFKTGVRVTLIFDICNSGGFTSPSTNETIIGTKNETILKNIFTFLSPTNKIAFNNLMINNASIPISASILEFAVPSRTLNVPDGILSQYTKAIFNAGSFYNWWKYNAEQYREAVNKSIDIEFLNIVSKFHTAIANEYCIYDQKLKSFLDSYANGFSSKKTISEMLDYYLKRSHIIYDGILTTMINNHYRFGNDSTMAEKFDSFLGNWRNWYRLSTFHNPHATFRGVKSKEFEEQYVFCI